MTWAKSGLK